MDYRAKQFKTAQSFQLYSAAIISAYKSIIESLNAVKAIAHQMDGKVYNKRFINAINDYLKNSQIGVWASASDQYNMGYQSMYLYVNNRDVSIDGYPYYFDKELYYNYIHNVQSQILTDNRIDYNKVCAVCDELLKGCNEQIQLWYDAATHFDEYTKQIQDAVKQFGESIKGVNKLFKPHEINSYDWEH